MLRLAGSSFKKSAMARLALPKSAQNLRPIITRNYRQIIDIDEEKKRQELQIERDNEEVIEYTDRVYKPTHTIEFNRTGEVVVFTSSPFKQRPIFNVYPYALFEMCIPANLYMFYMNPLHLSWEFRYSFIPLCFFLCFPRVWYIWSFNRRIEKMSLLRGGKVVKLEGRTIYGDIHYAWVHTKEFRPITEDFKNFDDRDNAEFLDEKGDLKYELAVECDRYVFQGTTYDNENIFFLKEGTVHQPELFEAIVKGYNIDTSDFTINTAHNDRAYEPSYNY